MVRHGASCQSGASSLSQTDPSSYVEKMLMRFPARTLDRIDAGEGHLRTAPSSSAPRWNENWNTASSPAQIPWSSLSTPTVRERTVRRGAA